MSDKEEPLKTQGYWVTKSNPKFPGVAILCFMDDEESPLVEVMFNLQEWKELNTHMMDSLSQYAN